MVVTNEVYHSLSSSQAIMAQLDAYFCPFSKISSSLKIQFNMDLGNGNPISNN